MTIFSYNGSTKNPEIGNTPVRVCPDIRTLGRVRENKFGTNVSNSYWTLQNFRTTTFTIFELLRENQQVIKLRLTHQPKLGLKKCLLEYLELLIFLTIKNHPGKIKNASLNLLLLIYIPINTLKKNQRFAVNLDECMGSCSSDNNLSNKVGAPH